MTRQLFIVTEEKLVLGRRKFHKDLASDCNIEKSDILGGGAFEQNETHLTLFGESFDFGKFNTDSVNNHIQNKNVFWLRRKNDRFTFDIDEDRIETDADAF